MTTSALSMDVILHSSYNFVYKKSQAALIANIMDFGFATADEIAAELGHRLKSARLTQALQQSDLAQRAGVAVGTVKKLEKTGQSTLISLIRVVQALGLGDDLQPLFAAKVRSIAEMERTAQSQRQRAPRRPRAQGSGA